MKLWLDDERPAPDGWIHAKTAWQAISMLKDYRVEEISLDHDLGPPEAGTGYDVAMFLEQSAATGRISRIVWNVHSANPVGRVRMEAALHSAERFWDFFENKVT